MLKLHYKEIRKHDITNTGYAGPLKAATSSNDYKVSGSQSSRNDKKYERWAKQVNADSANSEEKEMMKKNILKYYKRDSVYGQN